MYDIEPQVDLYHPSDLYGQQALAAKVGADQIAINFENYLSGKKCAGDVCKLLTDT